MKNLLFLFVATTLLIASSCGLEPEIVDPNVAGVIVGTYTMDSYETHSGTSDPNANDRVVISREDDTNVTVLIDYASLTADDVELSSVSVVESGTKYLLDRNFDNAMADGEVSGDILTLSIEYTNGNFVLITATR